MRKPCDAFTTLTAINVDINLIICCLPDCPVFTEEKLSQSVFTWPFTLRTTEWRCEMLSSDRESEPPNFHLEQGFKGWLADPMVPRIHPWTTSVFTAHYHKLKLSFSNTQQPLSPVFLICQKTWCQTSVWRQEVEQDVLSSSAAIAWLSAT